MTLEERLRHIYIIGRTGVGKTNLLKHIAGQDIRNGHGVAVISPHADLIDYLISEANDREEEVTLLDFGDPKYIPVINPLTMDAESEAETSQNILALVDLFAHRTFNQFTGPVFTDSVRLAVESVAALTPAAGPHPTLVAAIELARSDKLQRWAAKTLQDLRPDLAEEWERIFNMRASDASETSRWVTAKFSDLGVGSSLRAVLTDIRSSAFSVRKIYREGGILLVKLPDTRMPNASVSLLGDLLFGRIFREAQLADPITSKPFFVHVDEFQRFVSSDLEELVAEARKFQLGLTFAHQNLRQLEAFSAFEGSSNVRLADAIFSNVGTIVAMKTAGRDVSQFANELGVDESQIRGLARGQALLRTTRDGEDVVCSIRIPLKSPRRNATLGRVRKRMIEQGVWQEISEQQRRAELLLSDLRAAAVDMSIAATKKTDGLHSNPLPRKGGFLDDFLTKRQTVATQTQSENTNALKVKESTNDN